MRDCGSRRARAKQAPYGALPATAGSARLRQARGADRRAGADRLRGSPAPSSTRPGIELRGGAADEAPGAYKRLDAVLAAHGDTIEVVHRLTPLGVAMAGADTFDPYKD